jgi:NTP pyrophosphatase (non-canonical NTP hydrolase)
VKQKVTLDNYRDASIDDFYSDFAEIWQRDYKERSIFDLWLHVVDHASRIAKAVKREDPPAIVDDIADTTVWLMSFISFLENQSDENLGAFEKASPSKIIWDKYPCICPVCFDNIIIDSLNLLSVKDPLAEIRNSRHFVTDQLQKEVDNLYFKRCDCLTRVSNYDKRNELRTTVKSELVELRKIYSHFLLANKKLPIKIADIESMFEKIYESSNKIFSLESIMFNLLSEIGETTQAIVNLYTFDESREPYSLLLAEKRKIRLFEKIADILSWLFAASIKIKSTYGKIAESYYETITKKYDFSRNMSVLSFSDIIWSKYGMTPNGANWNGLKCPGCQGSPCECPRDLKINWDDASNKSTSPSKVIGKKDDDVNKDLIFISYSHKDEKWLDELKIMLKPLMGKMTLSFWDDTRIQSGKIWREEIESALSRSKHSILIVTPNFLASDFIQNNELPPLLESAQKGGTSINWIPFSSSMFTKTELERYQSLWPTNKPLDQLTKPQRNSALVEICNKIFNATNK